MLLRNSILTSLTAQRVNNKRSYKRLNRGRKSYLNKKCSYATATETEKVEKVQVADIPSKVGSTVPTTYGIAFNSPTWTKFLADILATEAEIPVPEITPQSLHDVYVTQLNEYRAAKAQILKEKVSESSYEGLLEIFILRSNLPLESIDKGLTIAGVYDQKKAGFKGTIGASFTEDGISDEKRPSNYFLNILYERRKRKEGFKFTPNFAKNLLSGISGLVKALDSGLTTEQIAKTKTLLAGEAGDILQQETNKNVMTPDAGYNAKIELLKQGKVKEAFPQPADLNAQEKETYDKFIAQQTEAWKNPTEALASLEFTQIVNNSDQLDVPKMENFLSIFEDKTVTNDQDNIRRMTIFNPVAETLFAHNLSALASPDVEFTEDYYEYSGGKLKRDDPAKTKGRQGWDVTKFMYNANVGTGNPRVAAELIMEAKLQRMAGYYGLNLENDIDNIKFHVFMDKYEVSPGEMTLEWVLTYPPPHHTFDELPIVKIPSDEDVEDYYRLN